MKTIILTFLSFFTLFSVVGAIPSEFVLAPRDSVAILGSKNLSSIPTEAIPAACQGNGQCVRGTLDFLSNCTTSMCMCSDDTNTQILGCLGCLVDQKAIEQKLSDALEAEYVNTCGAIGVRIKNAKAGNSAISNSISALLVGVVAAALGSLVV